MITFDDVSVVYDDGDNNSHSIFSHFTYTLGSEVSSTAIVGESGSGKSTLLSLMSLLKNPDAGRVLIDGEDMGRLSADERSAYRLEHIGIVFQEFNLVSELSLWENVAMPAVALGASFHSVKERAHELLARVGCADLASRFPAQISGGQMQRTAVARALINNPRFVVADEPTGNLDADTTKQVVQVLRDVADTARLIVVTHDDYVASCMEEVLVLRDGKLQRRSA